MNLICCVNLHVQDLQNHDGTFVSNFDKEPSSAADTSVDHVEYDGQLVTVAALFVMKTRDGGKSNTGTYDIVWHENNTGMPSPPFSYCMDP